MKHPALSVLTGAVLGLGLASSSHAVEILHWQRMPLAVPLVVGQERVIFVDHNVRVGVPPSLADHLRVQSAGGAVYLRPSAPIEPTRLQLQDADTGALILLDIAAESAKPDQEPLEPVRIVEDAAVAKQYGEDGRTDADRPTSASTQVAPETPIPVVLTRYAAQSLYAPLRTVEPVHGITRVNLRRGLPLDTLLPTLPVRSTALAAWRLDDDWVTAIRLTNTTSNWLTLDPRALQGDFVAATFQHPTLGPAGQSTDTSVLYLVTRDHGAADALLPSISAIDATINMPAAAGAAGPVHGGGHEK
ncbi:TIGR03749 family integrating conjugative element protein [Paraburkholderia ginsengisoli]|uniref:TIGR03749 family integrating conjugative element protein n=1 Tax=Paraburkholderia ginsengisoli TaxID=311231 RepID=A0A7T4N328_9BURK|nr:TIGR03749 family integrating conjugative element protein [Paraburkholderia ginsengisoli]QQC64346.1 TIGR03749 family integrating conjugative element protein [Paraburkholderia ginsengisoli]